MMELLSPAPSPEAAIAAVQNGANAIYLGFEGLTGCRSAVNFSDAAFESTVRYCRVRSCRVYLALDILVNDFETARAGGLALRAQRAGVDAIIVRDLGVFRILRRLLPEMPLYAAAELGFRTPQDAAMAAALGFKRIFLPPELNPEEIERMNGHGVETAVMVQGKLCAAVSGLCSMCLMAGQQSADRGLCTAVCREGYSLGGRWDSTPLSFKDRCLIHRLVDLEKAGVSCVWLGDRDMRAEYTAAFTAIYARAVQEGKLPAVSDLEKTHGIFSPYGYSETSEAAGAPRWEDGREVERFCGEQRRSYTGGSEVRRVPVEFAMAARSEHSRLRMGVVDGDGNKAVMDGPLPVFYGDVPLTETAVQEAMYKTAGTPYHCTNVRVAAKEGLAVARSELDMARRDLLEQLSEIRGKAPKRREGSFPAMPPSTAASAEPQVCFRFRTAEQMTRNMAALKPACVYAPLELIAEKPGVLEPFLDAGSVPVAVLPAVVCGAKEERELEAMLEKIRAAGVYQVCASSLGMALGALQAGLSVRGGAELGIFNSYALQNLAAAGFLSAVVSPQLSFEQIRAMAKPLPTEMVIYGRLSAMVTDRCLMKASAGRCTCATPGQLADERGGIWPVVREFGCRNRIYAPKKLFLADRAADWCSCGLWGVQLSFSTESPRECLEVARSYLEGSGYRPNGLTHGCCYKGVK